MEAHAWRRGPGRRRIDEFVLGAILVAGDEQYPVALAMPGVGLSRGAVVAEHHHADACLLRGREHLCACAKRVRSVFGVDVQHRRNVLIDPHPRLRLSLFS